MVAVSRPICRVEPVDLVEQDAGQLAVVVVEAAIQGLHQGGVFDPHPAAGQVGQLLRVTLPESRSRRMSAGGTNEGRNMPRSLSLANHTASSLSVFGRPEGPA